MSDPKKRPEYWYRLTTTTGPAAIERLELVREIRPDGGIEFRVVSRKIIEEKNVRAVVLARLGDMLDGAEES